MCATTFMCFGQWTYKHIKSDFDGTFKKAYTQINNGGFLLMEKGDKFPFFALSGSYFCDDTASIDFVLVCNGVNKKYDIVGTKSKDSKYYYFDEEVWTEEFINDFKSASKCLIRVNQEYCSSDYYQFNMSNSTASFNFINK